MTLLNQMTPEQIRSNLLVFILLILTLVAILFSIGNFKLSEGERTKREQVEKIKITLDNISLFAKAVSAYNLSQNKKIYGRNDKVMMPIASLAKIMTVVLALNNHNEGEVRSITLDAIREVGDFGLLANEKWKIEDLAILTLLVSANDGAYTLASSADFLENMNSKARKIGAENTLFVNFTGLDIDLNTAGALASAEDVNVMAMYAIRAYPEIFYATRTPEINLTSESGFVHNIKNTNVIINKIPNLLFSKTGFTEVAGGNLTVIFKNSRGEKIAVTVLGSTFEGRFTDMEKLVNVLYST